MSAFPVRKEDLDVYIQHMVRLEALYAGERLERPFFLQGIGGHSTVDAAADPAGWVADAVKSLDPAAGRGAIRVFSGRIFSNTGSMACILWMRCWAPRWCRHRRKAQAAGGPNA